MPIRLYVLKDSDTFMVADAEGNVLGDGDGLFHDDTRLLSKYVLSVGNKNASLLSATVSGDNALFISNLTNRPLPPLGGQSTPEGVIHLERTRLIHDGRMFEQIILENFAQTEAWVPLELSFAADFRDMFEVRGLARIRRGELQEPRFRYQGIEWLYRGLDGIVRRSCFAVSEVPDRLDRDRAEFLVHIPSGKSRALYIEVGSDYMAPSRERYRAAAARARFGARRSQRRGAKLLCSNPLFSEWLDKSRADLALLTTDLPTGPYPYAGTPWFSTPFGRDGIITALQVLWIDPEIAKGVLRYLAARQARQTSTFRDSAPGKIMHETRKGEMTNTGELPFGLYYGGVDTTPLFVMLAGAYAGRTGDLSLIDELWPVLLRAMEWIEGAGDSNGDGFVDYRRGADSGLVNQGWKDSKDSVFHADGSDPPGPIALIEVQGYAFAAFTAMADLAARRGEDALSSKWAQAAARIRDRVESRFWMASRSCYGMAIDGEGHLCEVLGSNVGHLLFAGVPCDERARAVIELLLTPAFDSGWGLRTLARGEPRFNPMSYHNGSVWPHDTALCVAGMARYGERDGVVTIMRDVFEAAVRFEMRLPELYCGFPSGAGDRPIAYPVACLPQAWASGSVFMLLQACLGIRIDGYRGEVHISRPRLPAGVDELKVCGIQVGDQKINITFHRVGSGVVAYSDAFFGGRVPVIQRND